MATENNTEKVIVDHVSIRSRTTILLFKSRRLTAQWVIVFISAILEAQSIIDHIQKWYLREKTSTLQMKRQRATKHHSSHLTMSMGERTCRPHRWLGHFQVLANQRRRSSTEDSANCVVIIYRINYSYNRYSQIYINNK